MEDQNLTLLLTSLAYLLAFFWFVSFVNLTTSISTGLTSSTNRREVYHIPRAGQDG